VLVIVSLATTGRSATQHCGLCLCWNLEAVTRYRRCIKQYSDTSVIAVAEVVFGVNNRCGACSIGIARPMPNSSASPSS
jgi:hypothetical protein